MSFVWVLDYLPVVLGFVWLVLANVLGMIPSKDNHWTRAYVLMALGLPLLIWIFMDFGIWFALAFLVAGGSILRWPLIYLWRWIKAKAV